MSSAAPMPTAPRSAGTRRLTQQHLLNYLALATAIAFCLLYVVRANISLLAETTRSTDSATFRAENASTFEERIGDEGILSQLSPPHSIIPPTFEVDVEYRRATSAGEEVQIAPGFHNEEKHKGMDADNGSHDRSAKVRDGANGDLTPAWFPPPEVMRVIDGGSIRNLQGAPGAVTDRHASAAAIQTDTPTKEVAIQTEAPTKDADRDGGVVRVYVYDLPTRFNWEIIHKFGAGPQFHSSLLQGPGVFATDKYGQAQDSGWGWPSERQAGNLTVLLPLGLEDLLFRQFCVAAPLLASLLTGLPSVKRVSNASEADLFFLPFFSSASFITFRGNDVHKRDLDQALQEEVLLWAGEQGGCLSRGPLCVVEAHHPHAAEHLLPALRRNTLLVADFWRPTKQAARSSWREKDVVAPYVPFMDKGGVGWGDRPLLLLFRGGIERKRGGAIRRRLADVLAGEEGVVFEEGESWAEGAPEGASEAMRHSKFCLSPAGDTPSSCRLFDSIASGCVPVVVSDRIELPFEDAVDWRAFAFFVPEKRAVVEKHLVSWLRGISEDTWTAMWLRLSEVAHHFKYSVPASPGGAEEMVWQAVARRVRGEGEGEFRTKRRAALRQWRYPQKQ